MTLELTPIPIAGNNKILNDTKELLGLPSNVTDFDLQLINHINSVLYTLTTIGVGEVNYQTTLTDGNLSLFVPNNEEIQATLQMYIFMKVRLLFDPPSSSFVLTSLEAQLKELEWRLVDLNYVPPV